MQQQNDIECNKSRIALVNSRWALGIACILFTCDILIYIGLIHPRTVLASIMLMFILFCSFVGLVIGLDALWQHWRNNRGRFFSTITKELMISLSPIAYIIAILLYPYTKVFFHMLLQ